MAIPSSGEIKISEIATEFGDTAPNQMSEYYRGGGLVPDTPANAAVPTSGQITVANFYGAQNRASVPLTISADTQNYDVYTQASSSPTYSAGSTDVTLTISPGVAVGSSSTGAYALSVPSSFNPADTVTIVNNGTVIGRGGNGGRGSGGPTAPGGAGGTGGNAVYVNFPTTITNNGTLAGAGGGGGGGGSGGAYGSGGGGGGGAGYTAGSGGAGGPYAPGSGSPGTLTSGGSGGGGLGGGPGGAGGGQGANGAAGPGSYYRPPGGGGTRGYYLVGNPLVTFPATGTRLGQVS